MDRPFCRRCGVEIEYARGVKFCPICGRFLQQPKRSAKWEKLDEALERISEYNRERYELPDALVYQVNIFIWEE